MRSSEQPDVRPDPLRDFNEALASAQAVENIEARIANSSSRLYEAGHAAREAGFTTLVDDTLRSAMELGPEHVKSQVRRALLYKNDREFRKHGVDGLSIRRVEFTDGCFTDDDLQVSCEVTSEGSFIPKVRRPGERTLLTIASAIQLFVPNDLPAERAAELHQRGFDFSGLEGRLNFDYGLRTIRRAVWGSGFCVFTDRRMVGLVIDDQVEGIGPSPERAAMPTAFIEENGSGTVVLLGVERALFDDCQISTGFLQNRVPTVNISGNCSLALDTYRLVDHSDRLVKPPKNAIGDGVKAFLGK